MFWLLSLLLGLLIVLAITAATGYFVAQEFAYMAVDRSRLAARAEAGDRAAARALKVARRTSFMLSGAQLGITVTGLLVGYVAEPLIGDALGTALGGVGIPAPVGFAVGTITALLLSTLIQMLFGELFPKNLAIARPEQLAVWLARSTTVYLTVFGWLISIFDRASNRLLRLVGIEPVHDVEHAATARDLEHIVAESSLSGTLSPELSTLLDRIIDFPKRDVEHAMIPAPRVQTVTTTDTIGQVRALMSTGHSRYPVLDADQDIAGVVQLLDLVATGPGRDSDPVTAIMRPPVLVPTSMPLPKALEHLSSQNAELAYVIDEYGGMAGIVTLEDLAEEVVGDVNDEHDLPDPEPEIVIEDESRWSMAGDVHLDEAERVLGRDLPRGDYETVAGLVIAEYGALPEPGARLEVGLPIDPAELTESDHPEARSMIIEILEVERHVPSRVRIALDRGTAPASTPDGGTDR
ncbi:hemolysin family protein [Microlunatus parietis]|uniref:CBS domain containing-hemolysin-like protein n=1 Tax=Microlunatus parietis TaxID=682979 RepID=A0A7Y9I3T4_9ACTN|nr:hemolysin family protein [Microlunatus parietis]NYE69460.1 CBS domain containing-hemolysin-like protein [Microlunatus parietis]